MSAPSLILAVFATFWASACAAPPNGGPQTAAPDFAAGTTRDFAFQSGGQSLSGVFDVPPEGAASGRADSVADALILFVHGYGETDVRGRNSYADLRDRFNQAGIATATWDKPGQGRSEGTFDIDQSVYDSAQEVLDAAQFFRDAGAPGAHKVGIWGISRAGWIAPIALSRDDKLSFWISVSGTTAEDNFAYLLLSNLPHEGGTKALADQLAQEWRKGCQIMRGGGSYDAYRTATTTLRANDYISRMRGPWPTRAQFEARQRTCRDDQCGGIDDNMCSYVFVEDFGGMMSSLDVDVLAIFGQNDRNVDWRKTKAFYEDAIGDNPGATLATHAFVGADHNLNVSKTGSIKEMEAGTSPGKVEGYYAVQMDWLETQVLADR